ncbi:hypothetical protein BG003_008585 [Podila horticola]|nr:hypothetical protein BG003_008585 [Podila horticola]
MGGTNLRTAAVHLLGDGRVGATVEKHEIAHQLKPALVKPCLTGLPTELVAPQTLVSHAYVSLSTKVSVILATGTNTAYIERASEVSKFKGPACDQMIHSTEWDAMGKA